MPRPDEQAKKGHGLTVYTSKTDKYDRCLADVFFQMSDGPIVFLNNYLLENGFAE